MTNRLYYDDPYLIQFTACVEHVQTQDQGESVVYLDRSAFYPTSGGQPYDTGTLGGCEILDVYVDESGDVAHKIRGTVREGTVVEGRINWERRFDHMQQHAGEHILAGCIFRRLNGHTIGLHLGREDSSIDVELPDGRMRLTEEELAALEDEVNAHIQADEAIRCWFPEAEELNRLPLRKPPTVKSHVRIVQIGEEEFCACGGTHPSTTGQIGLFKILDARPSRGKIRFTFVCGQRANRVFRKAFDAVNAAGRVLSADCGHLESAANEVMNRLKDTQYRLNCVLEEQVRNQLRQAAESAKRIGSVRAVCCIAESSDMKALTDAATELTAEEKTAVLLGGRNADGLLLVFAASAGVPADMGKLLSSAVRPVGGKGGGKADFARGSAPDAGCLETAYRALCRELEEN